MGQLTHWLRTLLFCLFVLHNSPIVFAEPADTTPENASPKDNPKALVQRTLKSLTITNKARVGRAVLCKDTFNDTSRDAKSKRCTPNDTSSDTHGKGPVISPGVVKAARVQAESTPQEPKGNHSEVAANIRIKYAVQTSDTDTSLLDTRSPGYWMVDSQDHAGRSPFAPQDYKVWRNVKDFGAEGDGVADDTEAINRAILEGGRCGRDCTSSTIYPAVVYFPPGTYLVSSPIVQCHNTQLLGHPRSMPTILAASSFVGLGVITSACHDDSGEYVAQNTGLQLAKPLRSIRNFKMDIRLADPHAHISAIHWQMSQGTSLEKIEFYMQYNSEVPGNTQQGIFIEAGLGGFLADLTFVGGNIGANFGNHQFATSHLIFVNCGTAVRVHRGRAWTMHDLIIESCSRGLIEAEHDPCSTSTNDGLGSLSIVDAIIANTPSGIVTSLNTENSASLLLQNVGFFNVEQAVHDSSQDRTVLAGGNEVHIDSWGLGFIVDSDGKRSFTKGYSLPAMNRSEELLGDAYDKMKPNFFTRRRPEYYGLSASKVMNVKALGAKGDGKTDDAPVLNSILEGAVNASSVVYFPHGVYIIKDTLRIPIGSRIIGQAWSQIMATGEKFEDESSPNVAVQVGREGDIGIIEIQDMMFTVSGPTAGAILVEWNAQESSKGSVGIWDSHFRVGGSLGSRLQADDCPKLASVNPKCRAASMILHLTPISTAYLENIAVWVAEHDLDGEPAEQIEVYSARGVLIESQRAWLWGTSSKRNALYQYQLSGATNVLLATIHTKSPSYQPRIGAPEPFTAGLFPNDPTFQSCSSNDPTCAMAWAIRMIDSLKVYLLSAGLYSRSSSSSGECQKQEEFQKRGFQIEESSDIWIYNLRTKDMFEMVSPERSIPTYAKNFANGYFSSILAWLSGSEDVTGRRKFPGFQAYTRDGLRRFNAPESCKATLTSKILCDQHILRFIEPTHRGTLENATTTRYVCDEGCGSSLKTWFESVDSACHGYNITNRIATFRGGRMWSGYNETCLRDPSSGQYCNAIIDEFPLVRNITDMAQCDICSECYVERLAMMQRTPYSFYDEVYKSKLDYVYPRCNLSGPTDIPPSVDGPPTSMTSDMCLSGKTYTTRGSSETCNSIALAHNVSSAALFMGNRDLQNCKSIPSGTELCLPLPCNTYALQPSDTCSTIESNNTDTIEGGRLRRYNPWIDDDCGNLQIYGKGWGGVLCLTPQGGEARAFSPGVNGGRTTPQPAPEYVPLMVPPPENVTVADGTTLDCGKWHVVTEDETCPSICVEEEIHVSLFLKANPSLGEDVVKCSRKLVKDSAYCTGPTVKFKLAHKSR